MANHLTIDNSVYPYINTEPARMMSAAIARLQSRGVSLRTLAGQLAYKSATVLSQLQRGRLPVPIERSAEIAAILDMDIPAFVRAVLKQRLPGIDFEALFAAPPSVDVEQSNELAEAIDFDALPGRVRVLCGQWGISTWGGLVKWCQHPELARRVDGTHNYSRTSQKHLEQILRDRGLLFLPTGKK